MDNYEGALETGQPQRKENRLAKTVEAYLPSPAYLGAAAGAMAVALTLHLAGRRKWGNWVAQWIPACLIMGICNQLVKIEARDRDDPSPNRGYAT